MISFVGGICLLLIAGQVFQVQCEPNKFAKEDKLLYDVVYEHASRRYDATKRKISGKNFKISGAEAEKVWMYIRHGTRSLKTFEISTLSRLDSVAQQDVTSFKNEKSVPFTQNGWNKLKTWNLNTSIDQSCYKANRKTDMITLTGKAELESVAANYKKRFPNLFIDNYSPNKFHILHSVEPRCQESMEIFFNKIFGQGVAERINGTVEGEDEEIIEAYRIYLESPQSAERPPNVELPKFYKSSAFKAMVERTVKKFRLPVNDYTEKHKLILNIFDMCRYEESWYSNRSVWCSFFKTNDILMLQYAADMHNFYGWGDGFEQNKQIQCPSIRDMVKTLEEGTIPVSVYFSHIPEVALHLVAMNAFAERQKLTAANYGAVSNRVWKSNKLIPFAANFAAVLYSNKQVKFFMNEELLEFSWCKKGVCNLKDLKGQFSQCF